MKQLFLFAVILLSAYTQIQAQDFTIKADKVIITNDGSPAELVIENSTKNIKGILVNKGNGHTEFRSIQKLNDSTFVIGTDTIIIKGAGKNLQQVTNAGKTTTHYINANGGYYQRDTLLLHGTDSIIKVGFLAGKLNGSADKNTVIGTQAMQKSAPGSANTAIGDHALQIDSLGSHNTAVGNQAMNANTTGSYNTAIGSSAMNSNTTGNNNIAIGRYSGWTTTASYSISMGFTAGSLNNTSIAIGNYALSRGSGLYNTAVGDAAIEYFNAVNGNTAVGSGALYGDNSGGGGSGSDNTMIGSFAGAGTISGSHNRNTAIGASSADGRWLSGVTAIGYGSHGASGLNNTAIGEGAIPYPRGIASNCTGIGKSAGTNMSFGSNSIAIGNSADILSTTDNYQLSIGNLIYGTGMDGIENTVSNGKIGIKTKTPAYELDVNGKLGVRSIDNIATAPNVLWQDAATGEIKKAAIITKQTFAQTATATVSGTSAESTLIAAGVGSLSIPASSWFAGKSFRVVVRGVYSSGSTGPDLTFKIKLGSTVIAQTSGITIDPGKTNVPYEVRGEIICRTTGASGNIFSRGLVITKDETVTKLNSGTSGTSVDLSSVKTLDVTVTMSNNATGNALSAFIVTFEAIN